MEPTAVVVARIAAAADTGIVPVPNPIGAPRP
jgi:hypothetical protein